MNIRFDGRALRATSAAESFPWLDRRVTLVRVTPDGVVVQAKSDGEKRAMLGDADDDDLLLAAWPGEWSQDVFVVDDLKGARASLGLPRYKAVATSAALPVDAVAWARGDDPRGLWGHLAGLDALPEEGQRQVAATPGFEARQVALAMLARQDLDEQARCILLKADGYQVPEALIGSGQLTGDEIAGVLRDHPDSGDLFEAALDTVSGKQAAQRMLASLDPATAARLWGQGYWQRPKRPALAAELLPVILAAPHGPMPAQSPDGDLDGRLALIRFMARDLPLAGRLELLGDPSYGMLVQRALLAEQRGFHGGSVDTLGDEELLACLPTITASMADVSTEGLPQVIRYVQRFPRLADIAATHIESALAELIVGGWHPVQLARSGQWDALALITRIADGASLLDELAKASVFGRTAKGPGQGSSFQQRWQDPARYDLVELIAGKPSTPDTAVAYILDRLGSAEIEDLSRSASSGSRLAALCMEALQQSSPQGASGPRATPRQVHLPDDEELSKADDPAAVLLDLIQSRGYGQDRRIQHVLDSAYMTDDLAWRLPVKALENHPVYGPRLAAEIAIICGSSPARWQELARAWSRQPTQLLAVNLFKRLRKVLAAE